MTLTVPLRRTILHLLHILFTDARTFIAHRPVHSKKKEHFSLTKELVDNIGHGGLFSKTKSRCPETGIRPWVRRAESLLGNMIFSRCPSFLKRDPHGQYPRNFHKAKLLQTNLFLTIDDSPSRQIIRGQLHRNPISGEYFNKMHSHLTGNVSQHPVSVIQFHLEHGVGQCLNDRPFYRYDVLFSHSLFFPRSPVPLSAYLTLLPSPFLINPS